MYDESSGYSLDQSCGEGRVLMFYDRFRVAGPGEAPVYVNSFRGCADAPVPGEDELPPLGQAAARAIVQELLPIPEPGLSPDHSSLTGLDTWVWYQDDGRLDLTNVDNEGAATLGADLSDHAGPYSLEATVWIHEYRWDMGSGDVLTSAHPGSEDDPAHIYYYVTKNDATTVTVTTTWRGTYTWTSPDGAGSGDLGTLVVTSEPLAYPVYEVRAVPVETSSD